MADRARDANLDRITIFLNSMGNGLGLKRERAVTSPYTTSSDQCKGLLLTLALAAGDPTALHTLGTPFKFGNTQDSSSWLVRHILQTLAQEQIDRKTPAHEESTIQTQRWSPVRMDRTQYPPPWRASASPGNYVELAKILIAKCKELGFGGGPFGLMGLGLVMKAGEPKQTIPT
jgi:hypothetical protein